MIKFQQNIALILGLLSLDSISSDTQCEVKIDKNQGLTLQYDLSKPLFGVTIHCTTLMNRNGELGFKRLTVGDFAFLYDPNSFCSMVNVSSKTCPVDNLCIESAQFYFCNFFGKKIKFKSGELTITIIVPT